MDQRLIGLTEKAQVLTAALPYIQKYSGKIVVIKYGGHAMVNEELKQNVMSDILLLQLVGVKVVLVHGGGTEITDTLEKLHIESHFINGLRYTDESTIGVVQMVLAGRVNKDLVTLIGKMGGDALGLCGIDGKMIRCKKHAAQDLGYVGDIVSVNSKPILTALENGYLPVIASLGVDDEGTVYNINADTAAAEIATALQAENIITLTDILGVMRDIRDKTSLIPEIRLNEIDLLVEQGVVSGGMIPKIRGLEKAIRKGVKKTVMIDGRTPHSILIEMFSDEGAGTMLKQ